MITLHRSWLGGGPALFVGALLTACFRPAPVDPAIAAAHAEEIVAWQAQRDLRLRSVNGWVTLVDLRPVEAGRHRIGGAVDNDVVLPRSAPPFLGWIVSERDTLVFEAAPGQRVDINGANVTGRRFLELEGRGPPTTVRVGAVRFNGVARGRELALRVRDDDRVSTRRFPGEEYFPVDYSYRRAGTLERFDPPKRVDMPSVLGGTTPEILLGAVHVDVGGAPLRLEALRGSDGQLLIAFRDATNGSETYGGGRFLSVKRPPPGTTDVVVDFNRAYNPPCAYSAAAACPVPPAANRMKVRIPAGERSPRGPYNPSS
jgi:uncharacterized protein (DUF1684 family)